MKISSAVGCALLALAPATVHAGGLEVGLLVDKQVGKAQTLAAPSNGLKAGNYDSVGPTGVGFRAAYTFLDLKIAGVGAVLTYHPKAEGDLKLGSNNLGKFGSEYSSVGLQADWKFIINLNAGIDYRFEKLTTSGPGLPSETTNQGRPWVRAGVGFSAPLPVVSPFVRLEVAAPLSTSSKGDSNEEFRKAMSPSFQVALYGGIRF
ncbi:hypothetical protein [Mesoterricola silvestris]|uniref:Outer membrane protein beta-barrel domain-containing protein n=1 Tax=Mesoterricola silvestris TaxID=2927979 RepID=A0AA48GKK2_9BACT|nr:hypothetical protein [Mesoterricola silvestris]BDU71140.1 hypothetical protein METEAL_03140 [Mesoterricola silvestris]